MWTVFGPSIFADVISFWFRADPQEKSSWEMEVEEEIWTSHFFRSGKGEAKKSIVFLPYFPSGWSVKLG